MSRFNVDDDGIKMFGMIIIAAIILILLSTCVTTPPPPPDRCPEGEVWLELLECCSADGITCSGPPTDCIVVLCEDQPCCKPDVCEEQPDGSEKCKGCSTSATCVDDDDCCKKMYCGKDSFCVNCENAQCYSNYDCCPKHECDDDKCKSCERTCEDEEDCCRTWECTPDGCKDCDRPCESVYDCCEGDSCYEKECYPCENGAECTQEKGCCPGFSCSILTNKCEPCENRPCDNNDDCCPKYTCNAFTNICQSIDNCEGLLCPNLGEDCEICDMDYNCEKCLDDSICANYGGLPRCVPRGNCPEGQVLCSAIGKNYLGCICCDPITTECGEGETISCSTVVNCEICSCLEPYDVVVCPKDTYYCKGKGCAKSSLFSEDSHTYTCHPCSMDPNACCTYLIPSDVAQMAEVIQVKLSECFSGYKYKGICISIIDFTEEDGIYTYKFTSEAWVLKGNIFEKIYFERSSGSSKIGPTEVVVSTVMIAEDDYCNLDDSVFSAPLLYRVGR